MSGISREEWLSALGEADQQTDPSALTTGELCALLQLGRTAANERIARLLKEGKATQTQKWATDSAGRRVRVPAYKLLKVAKAKRA